MPKGVYKRTEEHNRNLSKSLRGNQNKKGKHHSEESKKKMSEAQKGNQNRKGKLHSDKTKKQMRESQQKRKKRDGYINSPETRKKISELIQERKERDGYIQSPETRKKISESRLKKKEELGYLNSPEARKKMSEAKLKRKEELGYIQSPEARKKISEALKGEKNHMWNPNREEVYAPYGENFYNKVLRNDKWDLQNSRDMLTGTMLYPNKKPAYHHIDYCKSNDDPDNLCFLSINNHMRITGYQQNPIKSERYKKILQANTLALKNGEIPKNWSPLNKELFRQEKLKQLDLSLYI